MVSLKKFLVISGVVVLGLMSGPASAREEARGPIHLAFGPAAPRAYGLDDMFIDYVNGAKKTLDMAFYEFRLDSAVDAIIRAKKRGVDVRIVVDNDNYYVRPDPETEEHDPEAVRIAEIIEPAFEIRRTMATTPPINPFVQRLLDAGIPVKDDKGRSGLMHNKFAIRDHGMVWTGSYNLTDTCSFKNPNNAVTIQSAEMAGVYTAEFKEMFEDGLFGIKSPRQPCPPRIKVGDAEIEVLFAPEDNPNARVEQILKNATQEILFMQFAFTADELGQMLIHKKREGIAVRGIFDRILYRSTGPFGEYSRLTDAGIPVKIYSGEGKFHNKVFVVDPKGADPIVILGSGNASANGNKSNDENVLVIHSPTLAARFATEFKKYEGKFCGVSGHFATSDFPMAGTVLEETELMFFANDHAIDEIKIELPARWSVASQTTADVSVVRKNGNTTAREDISITGRNIVLKNARLKGTGPDSWVKLRFNNVWLPAIPGAYSLICSVRPENGRWSLLSRQPTIWVIDSAKEESFRDLLNFIKRLNLNMNQFSAFSEAEKKRQQQRLLRLNQKINHLICEAVKASNHVRVQTAVSWAEGLPHDGRQMAADATNNFKDIKQALQFKISHNEEGPWQDLLSRIEGLCKE
jgi:phosphatidylserine/phosphatidylglycerophosphate/cardiolipin synthase-like enzyme